MRRILFGAWLLVLVVWLLAGYARISLDRPDGTKAAYWTVFKTVKIGELQVSGTSTTMNLTLRESESSAEPGVKATEILAKCLVELANSKAAQAAAAGAK